MDYVTPELVTDGIASNLPFGTPRDNSLLSTAQPMAAFGVDEFSSFSKAVSRRAVRLSTRGARQRLIGGAGNDVLDASRGRGRNFLKGKGGNDRLMAGLSDRLFGDAGNDTLDARRGRGGNTLSGGAGNDILWAGAGGNQLIGGQGEDQFWIADRALPTSINTIRDFQIGVDTLRVNGIAEVTQFSDLTLTQQGSDTLVSVQGQAIALLSGVNLAPTTIVIVDPPPLPSLSISSISVSERDTGTTTAAVEVTLSSPRTIPVTVSYQTVAGTATANEDFTPVSGTLTFAPGETTKAIAISIVNDTIDEFDETFSLVLSSPTNATLANSQSVVTILDNDTTTVQGAGLHIQGGRFDGLTTDYEFQAYEISPTGTPRVDEDGNLNNDSGTFRGAIESFRGSIEDGDNYFFFEELTIGTTRTNSPGETFFADPLTFDLQAKFIPANSPVRFLDGATTIIDPFSDTPITAGANGRIEYTLTNDQVRQAAEIFEITLVITNLTGIDPIQAVNSLNYILSNQLFGRINRLRVSGTFNTRRNSRFEPQIYQGKSVWVNEEFTSRGSSSVSAQRTVQSINPGVVSQSSSSIVGAGNEPNDTLSTATNTGIEVNGVDRFRINAKIGDNPNISPGSDVDLYRIQLAAGERVAIDIDAAELGSTIDSQLTVFDTDGNTIRSRDDAAAPGENSSLDPYITFTATTGGVYYIGVSGSNNDYNPLVQGSGEFGEVGDYTLEIIVNEPNDTISRATNIQLSYNDIFETTREIGDNSPNSPGVDIDFYQIQLAAGDLLTIDVDTYDFAASVDRLDDSYIRVFNANGTELAISDDNAAPDEDEFPDFRDSYLEYTVTTAGTYYIGVSSYDNRFYDPVTGANTADGSTGLYSLSIRRSP